MKNTEFRTEWITAARNGDQEAIAHLYNCAYQSVHIVIRSMIRADEDTVLDLLQDTFVKAFQRLDQLDKPEKYMAWVKQIARNTVLDHLKKSRAILFSELQDDDSIPVEFEDGDLSHLPDVVIDQKDTARLLREMLDSLSDMQRTVFTMHYVEEISVKEIAELLGIREGTIKAHLHKARENLKRKLCALEEKENIRLHSMAPFPFLLLLLRNMESYPAQPDAAVLGNILQSSTTATGAAATAATAKAAGTVKAAGSAAAKGILVKIAAGVAAVTLCGGAVGMYLSQSQQPAEVPTNSPISTTSPTEPLSHPEHSAYEALAADYIAVIRREISVDQACVDLTTYTYTTTPGGSYIDGEGYFVVRSDVRYSFEEYDINNDGIMELLTLEKTFSDEFGWEIVFLDIFTFYDGEPVWLIAGEYRGTVDLCEGGIIRMVGSGGAQAHSYEFYEIVEGRLVLRDLAEENWGAYKLNHSDCTKEEFKHTIDKYPLIETLDFYPVASVDPQ